MWFRSGVASFPCSGQRQCCMNIIVIIILALMLQLAEAGQVVMPEYGPGIRWIQCSPAEAMARLQLKAPHRLSCNHCQAALTTLAVWSSNRLSCRSMVSGSIRVSGQES